MDAVAVLEDQKSGWEKKVEAAHSLGGSDDPRALAALVHALEATHEDVQAAAREALKKGGASRFADALRASNRTVEERQQAARILRHLREPAAVPALAHALGDANDGVRREAAHALAVYGAGSDGAKDALVNALEDSSSDVRYYAILALSGLPGNQARAALEAHSKIESDPVLRGELDRVLGR